MFRPTSVTLRLCATAYLLAVPAPGHGQQVGRGTWGTPSVSKRNAFSPIFHLMLALSLTLTVLAQAENTSAPAASSAMPAYRIEHEGFGASERDVRKICDAAGGPLWQYFPGHSVEPFVVTRGQDGPIVLFDRNADGEIVMRLDTGQTFWCQYAYQFAHEFCHILAGYDRDGGETKWFEETICETASLFAMRSMARSWQQDPPYPNWKDYRDALRSYADDVILQREEVDEIFRTGLPAFYQAHAEELRKQANRRDLNGAMAVVLLRLFETEPERWESVRWLNHTPSPAEETFPQYLQKWHDAVPERHQPFVKKIAGLYGIAELN